MSTGIRQRHGPGDTPETAAARATRTDCASRRAATTQQRIDGDLRSKRLSYTLPSLSSPIGGLEAGFERDRADEGC
ncbi:hypothetical protein [Burkholderia mayonis]|uniref:hypothetical protein n=1 Tax=Burkholderia mayonis TaxID=1385591 RepID=UPI00131F3CBA|nr:hypothetical protein [Burkholderia mayonis]